MNRTYKLPLASAGITMIEVLVSILVIALGLLGLAGLQSRMQQAELESYQRAQALVLMYGMIERIKINRATTSCFAITTDTTNGAPYLGTGSSALPVCAASATPSDNTMANTALSELDSLLKGAAETKGTAQAGAMVGARGCVSYDSTTELLNSASVVIPGTGIYTVAVSWQGQGDSAAPSVNCANTLYGAETRRRTVSTGFRVANLK